MCRTLHGTWLLSFPMTQYKYSNKVFEEEVTRKRKVYIHVLKDSWE